MMNRSLILFYSGLCLLLYSCGGNSKEQPKENIKPVKYVVISNSRGLQTKIFNGISRSGTETKLSFRANGLIVLQNLKVGDKVKKGQLLAKLDQKDISLSYEKAKSAVTSAKIQMETAQSNLDRIKQLYQSNSASLNDYEQAKNAFATAKSGYQTTQKSMDLQASQFDYTKIVAPTKGIISEVNVEVNEFVQAGTPIFMMNSGEGDLEVNVGVPEKYISKIKQSDEVKVTINGQQVIGVVSEVGYSTAGLSTYPVTVQLIDPNTDLRPGMPAEAAFQFGSPTSTETNLIVPVNAVSMDEQENYVYLLIKNQDSTFMVTKQAVEIGPLSNEGFTVLSGIKEGDRVAVAGLRSLYDGMKVSLLQ